ncbi:hypothetical protein [Sphingosinithalassobacter sp. CS137]|uniref:hypothetical protein n=1 Tax=Sphingosinithalassobacter sp. CS137 TaxID=2762748 RepID=UPI00165E5127|nr:hypothetical protein [Sphingosinithalassobacter sp. CS137]
MNPLQKRAVNKASSQLLRFAGKHALFYGTRDIPISHLQCEASRGLYVEQVLSLWEKWGWGRAEQHDDGFELQRKFIFSDRGIRAVRYRRSVDYFALISNRGSKKLVVIVTLLASLIAAMAASLSAYFAYLGLPQN